MTVTYIGLGSNLGDSRQILAEAVQSWQVWGRSKPPIYIKVHLWGHKISRIILMLSYS